MATGKEKTFTLDNILKILHDLQAEEAENCKRFCELNPQNEQGRKVEKYEFNLALFRVSQRFMTKAKGD